MSIAEDSYNPSNNNNTTNIVTFLSPTQPMPNYNQVPFTSGGVGNYSIYPLVYPTDTSNPKNLKWFILSVYFGYLPKNTTINLPLPYNFILSFYSVFPASYGPISISITGQNGGLANTASIVSSTDINDFTQSFLIIGY